MVAVPHDTPRVSLIEAGLARFAAMSGGRSRRATSPGRVRRSVAAFGRGVADTIGTLAALACFTVAAFLVGMVVGMVVAGVALLLLDFKVSVSRRARRAGTGGRQ